MAMSVGASIFSAVGIKNSDFGVLELMWKPDATRKCRLTAPPFPRVTVTGSTGAIVTERALLPGDCARAQLVTRSSALASGLLVRSTIGMLAQTSRLSS